MIMQTENHVNELYHHGVKGMKWGVRKDQKATSKGRVNVSVTDKNSKKREYTTINIKSPKRGGFKSFEESVKRGAEFINAHHHFMDMSIRQANQFAMEQATRASINASLQAASLSASGGMNPFMFGMI